MCLNVIPIMYKNIDYLATTRTQTTQRIFTLHCTFFTSSLIKNFNLTLTMCFDLDFKNNHIMKK